MVLALTLVSVGDGDAGIGVDCSVCVVAVVADVVGGVDAAFGGIEIMIAAAVVATVVVLLVSFVVVVVVLFWHGVSDVHCCGAVVVAVGVDAAFVAVHIEPFYTPPNTPSTTQRPR